MRINKHQNTFGHILKLIIPIGFILAIFVGALVGYMYIFLFHEEMFEGENEFSKNKQSIAELDLSIGQNKEYIEQYKKLQSDVDSLKSTYSANQLIRDNIADFELILGNRSAIGPGILLTIDIDLAQYWIIDIINELYDLGAEVIGVNDLFLTPQTSIQYDYESNNIYLNNKELEKPYVFKVIGNPNILLKGVTSNTGLLQNLYSNFPGKENLIEVEISDKVLLEAYN